MKHLKKFFATLLICSVLAFCLPFTANADEGLLNNDTLPLLECTFRDGEGNTYDGNALVSGDYFVDVNLSNLTSFSTFQFTADYDTNVVSIDSSQITWLQAQDGSVTVHVVKDQDAGRIVVATLSDNDYCTSIDTERTVFVTLPVTIDCENAETETIDFKDYFTFVTDPDLTLVQADYRDGYNDSFALDTTVQRSYNTYLMTADESPVENELEPGITVSGTVVIANNITGSVGSYGARGVYFKVDGEYLTDENGDRIVTSDEAGHYGEFSINLPEGTTEFQVVPGLSERMARTVTVAVTDDYEGAVIPVHYADYNNDGKCNGVDLSMFKGYMKVYNYYGDFNTDTKCNGVDLSIFKGFINKTLSYDEYVLE
jgi:hypothetical protein